MIESEELSLAYTGVTDSVVLFNLLDKVTGESNPVGFSLRYWKGYQNLGQHSGVYIFRPAENQYDSLIYSSMSDIQVSKCSTKS